MPASAYIASPEDAALLQAYKTVFESMDQGLFVIDKALQIIYINPNAIAFSKKTYHFTYAVGDHAINKLPSERQAAVRAIFDRVLNGETVSYEVEVPQADGSSEWLHCKDTPLYNAAGGLFGFAVLIKDITSQKRLEATHAKQLELQHQAHQSRVLFEEFMQNAPFVGWITDSSGKNRYMNPAFLQLYGLTPAAFGRSIYELFPAQEAIDQHLQNLRVLRKCRSVESIERQVLPDGREQVLRVHRFPIRQDGETMVAGWAIDITDQRRLEKQLQLSLERYYYVNEATTDAIYDWQVKENKIYRGNGFATLFGYIEQVASIRERLYKIHPQDREAIKKTYFSAVRDPLAEGWSIEFRFLCADGTYKHVLDKAMIIREGDKATRVLGALQDITEQKQLQQQLVHQEKTKKQEVVRSIIETQEKERRKLSVELHDNVNQMLASCKLMLEVACDGGSNALELTQKSYKGLVQIISEIRKISHDLNPSTMEDIGLVDAISEMIGAINATGKLRMAFRQQGWSKKGALKSTDNISIYRIIQEQVNNILKHAKATEAFIELYKVNTEIRLRMGDNGVGFDVTKAKKGLGLKNIQHRVDYYGGSLNVLSEKGKGATVEIRIKIEEEQKREAVLR